jgi:signal transduction histidine kinase
MPKSLEDYGLIPSLKSLVNKIKLSKRLNLQFYCNVNDELRFPIEVENNLYRVAQEALNNIIKHSEAKGVVLQLVAHERSIILTIEDDGKGFVKLQQKEDSGLGLQNIKNRISSIGGNLQIDTHQGYGTLITIEVDFKQQL